MEIVIKVNSTYNNTIVSALYRGKILKTISTGSLGFKKAKRASTLAAQSCGEALGSWLLLLHKNVAIAQKTRKTGLNQSGIDSTKDKELEYSVLQEAKKKLAANRLSPTSKVSKKKNLPERSDANHVATIDTNSLKDTSTQKHVSLLISGVGYGKFGVIRGLSKLGIKIKTISDVTAIPHNGCKPPKMRRK